MIVRVARHAPLTLLVLALTGCAGGMQRPAPVEDASSGGGLRLPYEGTRPDSRVVQPSPSGVTTYPLEQPGVIAYPIDPVTTGGGSAVVALLDTADRQRGSGDYHHAAVTLERALRIEPRNAFLWHRLAVVRLEQGQPRMALDLARKSNTLAGGDEALKRSNRQLIAKASRQLSK